MFANTFLTRSPIIFDAPLTLWMFVLGAGLGRWLLRRLRLTIPDALERGLFAVSLGMGALTFLPFAFFAVGLGQPRFLVAGFLLLTATVLPDCLATMQGVWRGLASGFQNWKRGPAWIKLVSAAMAPLLLVIFLQALCPPTDPDGLHYHLTAPLRYLAEGRFHYMPTYLHTNWPLAIEMLFGVGLAFNRYYAAGLVQFGMGIILLMATVALGRRTGSRAAGWLAAALTFSVIEGEMAMAYIDVGLTLFTVMSVYAFLIGWQALTVPAGRLPEDESVPVPAPSDGERWWMVSALLAGLSAGAKLPGILNVGLLALMAFWTLFSRGKTAGRFREAFLPALKYFVLGVLVVLPWYLRCWAQTNDPFYPYFASLFHARDWDAAAQRRMTAYFQYFNTLHARNLTPAQVIDVRVATCLVIAALGAAFCLWRGTRAIRPLAVYLVAYGFLQVATSGIYVRFFLPILPLFFLLPFWLLRQPLQRSTALQWAAALFVALRLWGMGHIAGAVRGQIATARKALPVALGTESRDTYLLHNPDTPAYAAMRMMNRMLPKNATVVLGLWEGNGALLDRRSLVTGIWTQNALRFDTFAHLLADLRRLHADYLLVHPSTTQNLDLRRLSWEDLEPATKVFPKLDKLKQSYGVKVLEARGYELYKLNLPAPKGATTQQPTPPRPPLRAS